MRARCGAGSLRRGHSSISSPPASSSSPAATASSASTTCPNASFPASCSTRRSPRRTSSGVAMRCGRSRVAARSPSEASPSIAASAVAWRQCARSSTGSWRKASSGVWPWTTAARRSSSPQACGVDGSVSGGGVLVSPFDSLLWDKPFVERVFGFQPLIEVYKREHERIYGYYVLPFLLGDRLVGRADLKADRAEGVLRVKSFHVEPGIRASKRLDEGLDRALARLARSLGLEQRGAMTIVTPEEARRIAVRAQLLDGSATSVLDTVRTPGLPPDRPHLYRRAASAPRACGAGSARLRPCRARPAALGGEEALRMAARSSGRSRICRSSAPACGRRGERCTPTNAAAASS